MSFRSHLDSKEQRKKINNGKADKSQGYCKWFFTKICRGLCDLYHLCLVVSDQ